MRKGHAGIGTRLFWCPIVCAITYALCTTPVTTAKADLSPPQPPHLGGPHEDLGQVITGEVVRIDGEYYVVRIPGGRELRVQVDPSTLRTGTISQGDHIEGRMNHEHHALSIRPVYVPRSGTEDGTVSR